MPSINYHLDGVPRHIVEVYQGYLFIYLFIYYANNPSRQTRDLKKSSTNSKNKLDNTNKKRTMSSNWHGVQLVTIGKNHPINKCPFMSVSCTRIQLIPLTDD